MAEASFTEGPVTFIASEALEKHRLVSIDPADTTKVVFCDAGMDPIGHIRQTVASGDFVAVTPLSGARTFKLEAAAAIVANSLVYPADDGKVDDLASGGSRTVGRFLDRGRGDAATGEEIEVSIIGTGSQVVGTVADSADVTSTTTKTAFDKTFTIQADTLRKGDVFRISGVVKADSTNSSDTLTYGVRLDGTDIFAALLVDVADNDVGVFQLYLTFRTIGATGTALVFGTFSDVDAEGAAAVQQGQAFYEDASIDTTGDIVIDATATWSVSSASNQAVLKSLIVEKLT